MNFRPAALAVLALAWMASDAAVAQTLYKLIDKNGKVTYSEKPPKDFDGKVIPMNIDPNANTATLPRFTPEPAAGSAGAASAPSNAGRVAKAKDALEAAKKVLANARDNPGEGDVQRVGNVGGGARPVPSEEYKARLEKLESAVKAAEKDLEEAERAS